MVGVPVGRGLAVAGLALTAALAPAAVSRAVPARPSATGTADWPAYQRNPQHSSATFADPAITVRNVGSLQPRWTFHPAGPTVSGQPENTLDASATVVGNRVYLGSGTGVFYALDAATGQVVWQRPLDYGQGPHGCYRKGVTGTAAVADDPVTGTPTVYAVGAHYLYALDAATGAVDWRVSVGPTGQQPGGGVYYNCSSPTVLDGRIFVGLGSACEPPEVRGGVASFDQHTGRLLHTYWTIRSGQVGDTVWSSVAADGSAVWATTGNSMPRDSVPGEADALIELSASSLGRLGWWTTGSPASADLDFGSSPVLWSATAGGPLNRVGACNKNGVFYAFQAADVSAGPVWQDRVAASSSTGDTCLASAGYDYRAHWLFVASSSTTVGGQQVPGALRQVNPATGGFGWQAALPCTAIGSPTVNGGTGLVAVPLYGDCSSGQTPGVDVFDESTGALLASFPAPSPVFAQPVFADGLLFVTGRGGYTAGGGVLTAYGP